MPSQLACVQCQHPLNAHEFVSSCASWFAKLDCIQFNCPHCSKPSELQLRSGRVSYGYIYAAGSAYFSPQKDEDVPGLEVEQLADGLKVTLEGVERLVPRD